MSLPSEQPSFESERLRLRPLRQDDAAAVKLLAGDIRAAQTTQNIPHPYEDGMAEAWIATQAEQWRAGTEAVFAITLPADDRLVGVTGLRLVPAHRHAELGYWIGFPYWNQGYATEAARSAVAFGFGTLGLHRIYARHMTRNPASGAVMRKLGMTYEGRQREHALRRGRFEDLEVYGLLRREWEAP